eukprot:TRINITY_DN10779_c0_g3_i1.p1 TRINITY_DN10779_c0_g3~~TRINITY_DN10779_c0_g3_i1.p1  ORF type:complete len:225 (-),score=-9.89 TRINITY_DN10779_c0_g3_i1:38-712(-)
MSPPIFGNDIQKYIKRYKLKKERSQEFVLQFYKYFTNKVTRFDLTIIIRPYLKLYQLNCLKLYQLNCLCTIHKLQQQKLLVNLRVLIVIQQQTFSLIKLGISRLFQAGQLEKLVNFPIVHPGIKRKNTLQLRPSLIIESKTLVQQLRPRAMSVFFCTQVTNTRNCFQVFGGNTTKNTSPHMAYFSISLNSKTLIFGKIQCQKTVTKTNSKVPKSSTIQVGPKNA